MADRSPLFLLLIFWTLSTGVFGEEDTHVSSKSGETVHLPCRNTDQHCNTSGTTWIYSSNRQTAAVELINLGVKKKNPERLNLGSDCSLTISRVTTEDDGLYTCQQWRGGNQKQGNDSHVYLHVVAAEAKTTPTTTTTTTTAAATSATTRTGAAAAVTPEHNTNTIKAAKTTTTVTPLHNTNPKIENPKAASPAPDPKAELKPQTEKTDETPKAEAQTAAAAVTPDHNTNTTTQAAGSSSAVLSVLLSAAALAVFIAAVLCLIQRRRRAAAHQRASGESAVKDENQVHYQTIHMSINPAARAHEQTEDSVTYSEVTCAGKKPEKSASDDDGNDSVTYAAVSRRA